MKNVRVALAIGLALVLSLAAAENAEAQVFISKYGRNGGISVGFGRGGVNVGGFVNTGNGALSFNNWGGVGGLGYNNWGAYPRYRGNRGFLDGYSGYYPSSRSWSYLNPPPRYDSPLMSSYLNPPPLYDSPAMRNYLNPPPYYGSGWGEGYSVPSYSVPVARPIPSYAVPQGVMPQATRSQRSGWHETGSGDFLPGARR